MTPLEQIRQSLEEALENVESLIADEQEPSFMDAYLQDPEAEESAIRWSSQHVIE